MKKLQHRLNSIGEPLNNFQIEELFKFFSHSYDLFCIANPEGYLVKVNAAFTQVLEYTEEELLSKPFFSFIHPDDEKFTVEKVKQIWNGESVDDFENRFIKKSGEYCWLCWSSIILHDGLVYSIGKDITAQRLAEEAWIESEKNYKALFENAPLPQWIYDLNTLKFLNVNKAALEHYGYSIGDFLKMSLLNIRPKEELELQRILLDKLKNSTETITYTATHVKKNRERITVEVTSSYITFKGKAARLVSINDITEKIKLQERLTNERVLRQKKIAQATIAAQEKEREFIGKELHDNINQQLASTKLFLEIAESREDIRVDLIKRCRDNVTSVINEIRSLSKSLIPPTLSDIGLIVTINELIEPYLLTGRFAIYFKHTGPTETLSDEVKLTLFRVIQEQLNNIDKYSEAKNIWITLKYHGSINLYILDDGKGFDTKVRRKGVGLNNITTRAELYNGTVRIISKPGSGCCLIVKIPVKLAAPTKALHSPFQMKIA